MNRKTKILSLFFRTGLTLMLLGWAGCGMPGHKQYRVGVLSGLDYFYTITESFKETMTQLGYAEGQNIIYEVQRSNVDIAAYRRILRRFVAEKVDLIFVFPTEASMEAKAMTKGTGIPVVAVNVFLENTHLVHSVREPGDNITGICWLGPDIALKRFEIMRELLPRARQIWVPYQKGYPTVQCQLTALRPAFKAAGLTLTEVPAENLPDLEKALTTYGKTRAPDAILNIVEPLSVQPDTFLAMARFAAKRGIPIGGAFMSVDGHESVFGLLPQNPPQGKQAAYLADKILKGAPAGSLPLVSADSFFQFNYRAAKKSGLNVPAGLLNRADEVVR